jgi:cytochrome P450
MLKIQEGVSRDVAADTCIVGPGNMVGLEGQAWKSLRSVFNPGFSASHLITLIPYIVDSGLVFLDLLREKAKTNELVELDPLSIGFAIDVIGKVVMDTDFDSQKRPHPIVTHFRKQVGLMPNGTTIGPFDNINLVRPIRLWWNGRILDRVLGDEIDNKVAARQRLRANMNGTLEKAGGNKARNRSIVDLALDAYEKEAAENAKAGRRTPSFRSMAIDSIKTFIFAGHDTTSSTISYTMYLLHLHPHVHKRFVKELASVYGLNITAQQMGDLMKQDPHSINKLEYLTCIVKEVLRLFSPASTIRELIRPEDVATTKTTYLTDPKTGKQYPMAGFHIWVTATMIHRNETYFPDPISFIPERFLPPSHPESKFPHAGLHRPEGKDAWRPFEKGSRNCIGQELAMMEAKVVIALIVAGGIDFTAEYDGKKIEVGDWKPVETRDEYVDGKPGKERMTIEGHRPYQVLYGAARPAGGMSGRLSLRKG